jgi:hypothetical protein
LLGSYAGFVIRKKARNQMEWKVAVSTCQELRQRLNLCEASRES